MKSAIQTLTDGLVFCKNYLRDNPDCSGQNKRIKQQQIVEHEKALKILTTSVDASKNTLPIDSVIISPDRINNYGRHQYNRGNLDLPIVKFEDWKD